VEESIQHDMTKDTSINVSSDYKNSLKAIKNTAKKGYFKLRETTKESQKVPICDWGKPITMSEGELMRELCQTKDNCPQENTEQEGSNLKKNRGDHLSPKEKEKKGGCLERKLDPTSKRILQTEKENQGLDETQAVTPINAIEFAKDKGSLKKQPTEKGREAIGGLSIFLRKDAKQNSSNNVRNMLKKKATTTRNKPQKKILYRKKHFTKRTKAEKKKRGLVDCCLACRKMQRNRHATEER
jgi:hypothetical protein